MNSPIYNEAQLAQFAAQPRLRDWKFPAGSRFEFQNPPDFSGMRHLQFLFFQDSSLPPGMLASLAPLPLLRRLDLSGCDFGKADFAAFCAAAPPKLTDLWLENTTIDDADLNHMARIEELEWVMLGQTRINDAAIPILLGLPRLRILMLGQTRVSPDAALELARLPQLLVYKDDPDFAEQFYAAHLKFHLSPRPVDSAARDTAQQLLNDFLRAMHDWEMEIVRESGQQDSVWESATRSKTAIVERFCTPQLLAKGVGVCGSYSASPQFNPDTEKWMAVEAKSKSYLIFYSHSRDSRWRRFLLKSTSGGWRLDGVHVHSGRWIRDFY